MTEWEWMDETHDSVDDLVDKLAPKPGPWDAMFRELDVEPTTPGEWRGRIGPGRTLHRGDPNGEGFVLPSDIRPWGNLSEAERQRIRLQSADVQARLRRNRQTAWLVKWWSTILIGLTYALLLAALGLRW